jgi:hypothetical protein
LQRTYKFQVPNFVPHGIRLAILSKAM